jgi:hypothetical protein
MSFIFFDGKTGALIDILSNRKLAKLVAHFKESLIPSHVKFLVSGLFDKKRKKAKNSFMLLAFFSNYLFI